MSAGFSCGAVATIVLYLVGALSETHYIWAFLIGAGIGDVVLALWFEAVAPTRVTVGPGERVHVSAPVRDRARVVSGFAADDAGKVRVRGEVWRARCLSWQGQQLSPGQEVRITGRDGLTLLIDIDDQ
ncbi:MAG: NfeD family protein [Gammaproteobacteria bacterium]|nr:NfeD family protein [Gammaproteobacteria bacterium]